MTILEKHPLSWRTSKGKTAWSIHDANGRSVLVGNPGPLKSPSDAGQELAELVIAAVASAHPPVISKEAQ